MPEVDGLLDPVLFLADCWDLRHSFDALIAELDTELPLHVTRLHGLLLVLLTSFFRLAERGIGSPLDIAHRRAVQEYVDSHIRERITVADLASAASLSPTRFTRRFRQTFSVPPRTWIMHRRIHYAALLMDTSTKTITQVARSLGYQDIYLFSRQFKQVVGVSPRAYRKRRG
jgi:AraC-like DNA-binding protein